MNPPAIAAEAARRRLALPLFWRTFALIALLLAVSLGIWIRLSHLLQDQRLGRLTATEFASLMAIARSTLDLPDPARRDALLQDLNQHQDIDIFPRRASDTWIPLTPPGYAAELKQRIESEAPGPVQVAGSVNGHAGAWVAFELGGQPYWLRVRRVRSDEADGETWAVEIALAGVLALVGAATITNLLNRPLRDLVAATARVREGDYAHALDDDPGTPEIREVNRGFNRMARALHDMERDRALMLAGISHDIRTPLARLRLEAELSVPDALARHDMANDIEQADNIISKLLEYASTAVPARDPVPLAELLGKIAVDYEKAPDIRIDLQSAVGISVLGDALELHRIMVNLLENARRYGRSADCDLAEVEIGVVRRAEEIVIAVRDHGHGVPDEQLPLLTRPFYRLDPARTPGKGSGLGLAIVDRTVARMGGRLSIVNARGGGLLVRLWLPRDPIDGQPRP